MKSVKLEIFRDNLVEILNENYPDYKIDQYLNGFGSISWLSVVEYPANLKIAEVIVVERFGPVDSPCDSLLVIDYVNSDSRRYDNADNALFYMKSILCTASDRKAANLESLRDDVIKTGVIDPNKCYLVTGRRNGKMMYYHAFLRYLFGLKIKDIIFNDPATIVFWEDGEKTIVQCQDGEPFDPEKGLAMAISKKVYGNKYSYYDVFKKWVGKYNKKKDKTKNPREGTNFNDYLNEQLKDPEFKKQYENTEVLKPYCNTSKENDNEQ